MYSVLLYLIYVFAIPSTLNLNKCVLSSYDPIYIYTLHMCTQFAIPSILTLNIYTAFSIDSTLIINEYVFSFQYPVHLYLIYVYPVLNLSTLILSSQYSVHLNAIYVFSSQYSLKVYTQCTYLVQNYVHSTQYIYT